MVALACRRLAGPSPRRRPADSAPPCREPGGGRVDPLPSTFRIVNSLDDVNESDSAFDERRDQISGSAPAASASSSYTGLRFPLEHPAAARPSRRRALEVNAAQTQWLALAFELGIEAAGNAATFSHLSPPSARPGSRRGACTTRQRVVGSRIAWQLLGEVGPLLQDVVNRADWTAPSSAVFVLRGQGGPWGRKFAHSFDAQPALRPSAGRRLPDRRDCAAAYPAAARSAPAGGRLQQRRRPVGLDQLNVDHRSRPTGGCWSPSGPAGYGSCCRAGTTTNRRRSCSSPTSRPRSASARSSIWRSIPASPRMAITTCSTRGVRPSGTWCRASRRLAIPPAWPPRGSSSRIRQRRPTSTTAAVWSSAPMAGSISPSVTARIPRPGPPTYRNA